MRTGGSDMDAVNHPAHYRHPVFSGECYDVIKYCDLTTGNVIKYLWRTGRKDATLQDLNKALWFVSALPAPNISIIPQAIVDRMAKESAAFREESESDVLWCTVVAIIHLVNRRHDAAAEFIRMAIQRAEA